MFRNLSLLLLSAVLAACVRRPAPEPDRCYTLILICDGNREPISVSDHWTDLRPPSLSVVCWVRCDTGTRGCVSTDGCTWLEVK